MNKQKSVIPDLNQVFFQTLRLDFQLDFADMITMEILEHMCMTDLNTPLWEDRASSYSVVQLMTVRRRVRQVPGVLLGHWSVNRECSYSVVQLTTVRRARQGPGPLLGHWLVAGGHKICL